ncbi:RrF2 family transcriptional regulator [Cetobacterium sp.]|uniref:RrF2 family transcriptional regulator n=1 Tax=Cetobacterium sp. TaxID=2071632 RepID=UPI003EE55C15
MRISVESDYAIRIILYLFKKENLISGLEIVEYCEIPERMGLRILTKLTASGLLKSVKGKNGGFFFPKENSDISLFDVVSLFDSFTINRCLSSPKNCTYKHGDCVVCEALKEINNDIIKSFSKVLIKDLWMNEKN